MLKRILSLTCLLGAVTLTPGLAASSFQNSCSQISFAYATNSPIISAVCLRANGTTNATSMTIQGVANENGVLTQASGASTFQESCGNIQIAVNGGNVSLTAYCRNAAGASAPTSLPLNNISNNNGVLSQ